MSTRIRPAAITTGTGALAAMIVVAALLTPGYNPMADAISQLASHDEPHALLARAALAVYGLSVIAGAAALGKYAAARERVLARLIAGFGAATVVTGLAQKDPPGGPHTLMSQIHVDAAIVAGALLLMAMALVARSAPRRSDRVAAVTVATLAVLGVVVFPFTWGSPVYGLVELLLLGLGIGWLLALALRTP